METKESACKCGAVINKKNFNVKHGRKKKIMVEEGISLQQNITLTCKNCSTALVLTAIFPPQ